MTGREKRPGVPTTLREGLVDALVFIPTLGRTTRRRRQERARLVSKEPNQSKIVRDTLYLIEDAARRSLRGGSEGKDADAEIGRYREDALAQGPQSTLGQAMILSGILTREEFPQK